MIETPLSHPVIILLIGVVIVLALLIKSGLKRLGLPPLVGFVSTVTCIGSPLAVRRLLGRWPETREAG